MRIHSAVGCAVVLLAAWISTAAGDDFRIESKVFVGKDKTPSSQTTTLFRAGVVYDYLSDPPKVAIFDKPRGRFILLDPTRKVKTEIKIEELLRFTERLRQLAAEGQNAQLKGMVRPEFAKQIDEKTDELVLTSDAMTYRLQTMKPDSTAAVQQYREFSDWYARLNSMTNPSSIPPFPRLAVNEELADRGLLATQVQLTIPAAKQFTGKAINLRSEHKIAWRLLQRDTAQIAETAGQLASFELVSLTAYRQASDSIKR